MFARKVVDEDGRIWECKAEGNAELPGRDVNLVCSSKGVSPFRVRVGWLWSKMAERGLARLILDAAPPLAAR